MKLVLGVDKEADGALCFTLPAPRGIAAFFALVVSGLVFAVSGLVLVVGLSMAVEPPAVLILCASVSLVSLVWCIVDRTMAQKKSGISIKMLPAKNRGDSVTYQVYCGEKRGEEGELSTSNFVLVHIQHPGTATRLLQPIFIFALCAREVDERYRADIAGNPGYVLLRGTGRTPEEILERIDKICDALNVDVKQVLTVCGDGSGV